MAELPKSDNSLADHAVEFEIPLYNVWKQQEKTKILTYFFSTSIGAPTTYINFVS